MPSCQGLSVILMLVVTMATQSAEAFGGRRKNMAHIFGKRSDYKGDVTNDVTIQDLLNYIRTNSGPYRTSELRDLDYVYSPESESREQGAYPIVGVANNEYSALADDSISPVDMTRLRDSGALGEGGRRKASEMQAVLANYVLNKLARGQK